jgi:hypothetical protein
MRGRTVLLAVGLAAIAACTNPTEPTHSATGTWAGALGPAALRLSLVMHPDRSVSGVGIDSTAANLTQFPVRGRVSGSTVVLLFSPTSIDSGFSGRFSDASKIEGSLDLPGLSADVVLRRQ